MSALRRAFPIVAHANLANAITAMNALFGVIGIYFAARGAPGPTLLCSALSFPCDVFDGVVARRTGTSSEFGAQLDSLADAVSFCLLPAAFALALATPWYTHVAALLFAVTGLLRLARFGVVGTSNATGVEAFEGVPTLYAATLLLIVSAIALWLPRSTHGVLLAVSYLVLSPTMVSGLAFPKRGLHTRAMWVLVPAALVLTWLKLR